MNTEKLTALEHAILEPGFFSFFSSQDSGNLVDTRAELSFENTWMANSYRLAQTPIEQATLSALGQFRAQVFKTVLDETRDAILAEYVSDDMELIAKDMMLENEQSWPMTYLWESYLDRRFPA